MHAEGSSSHESRSCSYPFFSLSLLCASLFFSLPRVFLCGLPGTAVSAAASASSVAQISVLQPADTATNGMGRRQYSAIAAKEGRVFIYGGEK